MRIAMVVVFVVAGCGGGATKPSADAGTSVDAATLTLDSGSSAMPDASTPVDAGPAAFDLTPPNEDGAKAVTYDKHITVDQFGYRPNDAKVAVVRNPLKGRDSTDTFTPGAMYSLCKASDGTSVLTAAPTKWSGGTDSNSGDEGWWFDFSTVTTPGTYFVQDDDKKVRSPVFSIGQDVYVETLKAAMRMFYYQRSGTAKLVANAGANWTDGASFLGPNQSSQAHDVTDQTNASKVRDMSGGWFDAGDTNKYVNNATQAVNRLLTAYEQNPSVFTDDYDIPESGNGVPDILDEVKWEMDWLVKMQNSDGTVAPKVGVLDYPSDAPNKGPSSITDPIFYIPTCTSGTIEAAGIYAHAAIVLAKIPSLASYASNLQSRAVMAWSKIPMSSATAINTSALQTACDSGAVKAGLDDETVAQQVASAAKSAIYLYALTGQASYETFFAANYKSMEPFTDVGWSVYGPDQAEALLYYTTLSNANATVKAGILAGKMNNMKAASDVYGFNEGASLYRAHFDQFVWGSSEWRANFGTSNLDVVTYNLAGTNAATYTQRALELVHFFHGVNPFGMVYLTNMYAYGATLSANEIFHTWFEPNSPWSDAKTSMYGPAPGYLPGGPQTGYGPVAGQPPEKCYEDTNSDTDSYEITEPGIYYQASYVKLLSSFAH